MTESKTEKFIRILICLFVVFLMGILTIAGIFSTTGMEIIDFGNEVDNVVQRIRDGNEVVWYYHDNIFANLIWLAVEFAVCFAVMPYLKKLSLKWEILFISVWVIFLGSIWVISSQVSPTYDSEKVVCAAAEAAQNQFSFMQDNYFSYYSYQLGYVLFNEIIFRIHNLFVQEDTFLFLEFLNVVFLAGIYAGILTLNQLLFKDCRIHQLTTLLLVFSIQPLLACVFIYAIYPGLLFAVWGMVFEVLYFQTQKIRFISLSAVCIALAYLIKPNYLIFLIAMLIIAGTKGLSLFKEPVKLTICFAYILLSCCLSFLLPNYVTKFYETRSGIYLGDAIPMTSFIAMGLNCADSAPGWYNENYTVINFENHQCNAKEASHTSVENIKEQLQHFSQDKHYRNEFFYRKFMSQWNETSYQSIWNNKVREQYQPKGKFSEWVCYSGEQAVKSYMDIYTQLIFTGVLLGGIVCFRKKNFMQIFSPLVIIGGMLYHLMAESKSQYAMPYYILMTGFAAVGICWLYDILKPELANFKLNWRNGNGTKKSHPSQ